MLLTACEALAYAYAAFCIAARRREGRQRQETLNLWPLSLFFFAGGLLFFLLNVLSHGAGAFALFSFPIAFASLFCSNVRVRWDPHGFWYRTALRREIRYEYSDITRMRQCGYSGYHSDLIFKAGKRWICLDSIQGWERFASVYLNWQTQNGRVSWREEQQQQWMARYLRHSPFLRKLDRISNGRSLLILTLICGLIFISAGLLGLLSIRPDTAKNAILFVISILFILVGVLFPLGYILSVSGMNRRFLRFYTKGRIRPDPLEPVKPKRYRRNK